MSGGQKEEVAGYSLPLFRSLTQKILMAGAPKNVIIGNLTLLAFFALSLHFFWIIPLNLAVHFLAIYLTKRDEQFFDCLRIYIKKKDYYST